MPRRGHRRHFPGKGNRSSANPHSNEQAMQYANESSAQPSTRYTLSESNIADAVTFASASLQQAQGGFHDPAHREGRPAAQYPEEGESFVHTNVMHTHASQDWQYNADEHTGLEGQFSEYADAQYAGGWSADQRNIANDVPLRPDMLYVDVSTGVGGQTEQSWYGTAHSLNQSAAMSTSIYPVHADTPPWSAYNSNGFERRQLLREMRMSGGGSGMYTTTRSTYFAETSESSYEFVNAPEVSSMSSLSQQKKDLAASSLTVCPDQQARTGPEIQFDDVDSDRGNASQDPGKGSLLGERGRQSAAPDLDTVAHGTLFPYDPNLLSPTQTNSINDCATSTTGSSASAPDTVRCVICGVDFRGKFRAGNLARHGRTLHKGAPALGCVVPTCRKVFKRQDARLKHIRKHHPGRASSPILRPERRRSNMLPEQHHDDQNYALNNVGAGLEMDLSDVMGAGEPGGIDANREFQDLALSEDPGLQDHDFFHLS